MCVFGVEHPVAVRVEQRADLAPELRVGLLDPDVDLAAAREADLPGLAVGDAVVDARGRRSPAKSCFARSTTSASTQPPETEPTNRPLSRIDHLRAGLARRRADRVDHGRDDDLLARRGRLVDRVEDRRCIGVYDSAGGLQRRADLAAAPRAARGADRAGVGLGRASRPPAITSPVERISGPRVAAPGKRSAGNTASFAQARDGHGALRQAERGERLAEQQPHRVLDERHAGRLGDERHRARGARVRLEHAEPAAGDGELEVDQAARAEPARDPRRDLADLVLERRR